MCYNGVLYMTLNYILEVPVLEICGMWSQHFITITSSSLLIRSGRAPSMGPIDLFENH